MLDTKGNIHTHSENVILTAFPLQQLLDRGSLLRDSTLPALLISVTYNNAADVCTFKVEMTVLRFGR